MEKDDYKITNKYKSKHISNYYSLIKTIPDLVNFCESSCLKESSYYNQSLSKTEINCIKSCTNKNLEIFSYSLTLIDSTEEE